MAALKTEIFLDPTVVRFTNSFAVLLLVNIEWFRQRAASKSMRPDVYRILGPLLFMSLPNASHQIHWTLSAGPPGLSAQTDKYAFFGQRSIYCRPP